MSTFNMDEFVLPACSKITITFKEGELFINQECMQADEQVINVPADRVPAFIDAIQKIATSNGIISEPKKAAPVNGRATAQS